MDASTDFVNERHGIVPVVDGIEYQLPNRLSSYYHSSRVYVSFSFKCAMSSTRSSLHRFVIAPVMLALSFGMSG